MSLTNALAKCVSLYHPDEAYDYMRVVQSITAGLEEAMLGLTFPT